MLEKIIGAIAPHICLVCESEGRLLCSWCAPDAVKVIPSRCYRCSASTQDDAVCKKCRTNTVLRYVWVASVYEGTAKQLIRKLKFERAKAAAKLIAEYIHQNTPNLPPETLVTYVPTANRRVRLRGYDQSKLVAQRLARLRRLKCAPLLVRHGHSRQVRSSRTARAKQAAENYTAKHETIPYQTVLLIDDILTTGATIEAAAKVLRKAGVKHVNAAVFAQKQ